MQKTRSTIPMILLSFLAGFALAETIDGSGGDDSLGGTPGADIINGNAGNDHIEGLEGDDQLSGGEGSDSVKGGEGADLLSGGPGADTLFDWHGATTIWDGDVDKGADGAKDTIDTLDGEGDDTIHCGFEDEVNADPDDRVLVHDKSGGTMYAGPFAGYVTWKAGQANGHEVGRKLH